MKATKITQLVPTTGATTTGKGFSVQLKLSGSHDTVSFVETSGAPHLKLTRSGVISAPSNLAKGLYKAAGTVSDSLGDSGTWSFELIVTSETIHQLAPSRATTGVGRAFHGRIRVSGALGAVTYSQSSGAPEVRVSSSGAITASATLAKGTYKATGEARDTDDDSGNWSFTLTVAATRLAQLSPTTAKTPTGHAYLTRLRISGAHGNVFYSQSSGAPRLTVSSSGAISAPADLPAGQYKASGAVRDSFGDKGVWSFTLAVIAGPLVQVSPMRESIGAGKAFADRVVISGWHGSVRFTQSSGAPEVSVTSSGAISAPVLKVGTYMASGRVSDSLGDSGAWSFTLTVVGSKLAQIAPDTASVATGKPFSAKLKVSGAHGTLAYSESKGAPRLKVSRAGTITALDSLPAGRYKASGTEKDSVGDAGTWTFTLIVKAVALKQLAPKSATVASAKTFTGQLKVSGARARSPSPS